MGLEIQHFFFHTILLPSPHLNVAGTRWQTLTRGGWGRERDLPCSGLVMAGDKEKDH